MPPFVERHDTVEHTDINFVCSAAGDVLPLTITHSGIHLTEAQVATDLDAYHYITSSGWTGVEGWRGCVQGLIKYLDEKGIEKALLHVDGHRQHCDLSAIELMIRRNITLLFLHPKATHARQPADKAFGPIKQVMLDLASERGVAITATNLVELFVEALKIGSLKSGKDPRQWITHAWKVTGLWPVNREAICEKVVRISNSLIGLDPTTARARAFCENTPAKLAAFKENVGGDFTPDQLKGSKNYMEMQYSKNPGWHIGTGREAIARIAAAAIKKVTKKRIAAEEKTAKSAAKALAKEVAAAKRVE